MKHRLSCLVVVCVIAVLSGSAMSAGPAKSVADTLGGVHYDVEPAARKRLQEIGYHKSTLGHLVKYAGTYDYYSVLNDPAVLGQLRSLLGTELSHLFQNIGVLGPIDLVGSELELTGGRAHETHVERAFISVNVVMGTVEAIIFSHGKSTVYSRAKNYRGLHGATRMKLHMSEINAMLARPPTGNVVFAR